MFFTFYSFSGGTGQSLALANAAYHLAMKGMKVLVLDMNFQNPSMPKLLGLDQGEERGLVDLVESHLQGAPGIPLNDILMYVPRPRDMRGELFVLSAGGRRGGAPARSPDIPWDKLYREHEGYLFFENLKGEIQNRLKPDIVLVDGGSGYFDPAGISVLQVADSLILFTNSSNLALDALARGGSSFIPSDGPGTRGTRERLVVVSPMPSASEEAVAKCLKTASKGAGALRSISVPYTPTQAWTADGRMIHTRPGEPVSQAYRSLARWLDGSGLGAQGFRMRIESQAHRPEAVISLLQRVTNPKKAVLQAVREALVQEGISRKSGEPLALKVSSAPVPFGWQVVAAEALLEIEVSRAGSVLEGALLGDALALHQVRHLAVVRIPREVEGDALVALSRRNSGVLEGEVLLEAVQSLQHRGGEIPVEAVLTVLETVVQEGVPSLSGQAVHLATRLPRWSHERVVSWLMSLDLDQGVDVQAVVDAVAKVGSSSPMRATRCLAHLWTGSSSKGFPYRPALMALRHLLESIPRDISPLLIEEGSRLLAKDFDNGWREEKGRSALWYALAPAHQGSALIGLVEDALSQWLIVGDKRASAILDGLLSSSRSVARWVLLGALPLAPASQRRKIIGAVREGFRFPPPGAHRRWDAAGVAWGAAQGPNAPSEDPVAVSLVEDMTRSGLRPPTEVRAQAMLRTLGEEAELPKGLVLATIHHALSAEKKLPIHLGLVAETTIFRSLPNMDAVEALVDLVRHRGATPALQGALVQLINEKEAGSHAVSDGLKSLAETQPKLAEKLAKNLLEVGPPLECWAGLLTLSHDFGGRSKPLLEQVLRSLAENDDLLPAKALLALEDAIVSALTAQKRIFQQACFTLLTNGAVPQAARRKICRKLAGLIGAGFEGGRAVRMLGHLLEHDDPEVRSAAALAAVDGALSSRPQTSLTADILGRMAAEVERERPALDVMYALLRYLVEWSSDLLGSYVAMVAKVMLPTSPASAEPRLVALALDVLARILRAGRVDAQFLEGARTLRDDLKEGSEERRGYKSSAPCEGLFAHARVWDCGPAFFGRWGGVVRWGFCPGDTQHRQCDPLKGDAVFLMRSGRSYVQLRTFIYLDVLQPQLADFIATVARGFMPLEHQAALMVEVAPGLSVTRLTDIALKTTRAVPGMEVVERSYGLLELHSYDQGEIRAAGDAILDHLGFTIEDRLKPRVVSSEIITGITGHHAMLLNRMRHGNVIHEGQALYVLETHPAAYAALAANEAEKASPVDLLEVRTFGAFGRLFMGGGVDEIREAAKAAEAALADVTGKPNTP